MTVFYIHRFVHTVRNGDPHCLVLEARMETGLQGLRFGSVSGKASGMGSGVTEVPVMTRQIYEDLMLMRKGNRLGHKSGLAGRTAFPCPLPGS